MNLHYLLFLATSLIGSSGGPSPEPERPAYRHLPDFATPKEFTADYYYQPIAYLQTFPVTNPRTTLPPAVRKNLQQLFLAAYDACIKKYRQDYSLSTDVPIYQLLRYNEPVVQALPPTEGGHIVFLGHIARALRQSLDKTKPNATGDRSKKH